MTGFQGGLAEKQQCRVVLLLDLDCFYAQVEQKRCGIPKDVPCAVQQWEGLIAVNYAARARGVTRHMRAPEARVKCPEIQLVHVQTLGGEENVTEDAQSLPGGDPTTNNGHSRLTHKACLERYREASAQIMAIIRKLTPGAIVERASIDEMYIDVTSMVEEELRQQARGGDPASSPGLAFGWGGVVIDGPLRVDSEFERRLSVGAMIALRLRNAVNEKLGYTASAGVACNKLLAKVAAGLHKPNQQTIVPPRAAEALLADMPLGKIRNFGGKLGAELQSMGCSTPAQVTKLPFQVLEERFGDRARWILSAMRGISDDPVVEKELPKSMLAAKSFEATRDWRALQRWLAILAEELAARMAADALANHRHPRSLLLHYRASGSGATTAAGRTKTGPMPYFGRQKPHADAIAGAALKLAQIQSWLMSTRLLVQSCSDLLPCFQLAISATDFASAPVAKHKSIERFFGAASGSRKANSGADAAQLDTGGTAQQDTVAGEATKSAAVRSQLKPQGSDRGRGGDGNGADQPTSQHRSAGQQAGAHTIESLFGRAATEQPSAQLSAGPTGGGSSGQPAQPKQQTRQSAFASASAADASSAAAAARAEAAASRSTRTFRFRPEPPHPADTGKTAASARPSSSLQRTGSPFEQRMTAQAAAAAATVPDSAAAASGGDGTAASSAFAGQQSPTGFERANGSGQSAACGAAATGGSAFSGLLPPLQPCLADEQQRFDREQEADTGVSLARLSPLARSGSGSQTSSGSSGMARSGLSRRSPTAAAVAARRDAFAAAADAAIAAVSGSLASDSFSLDSGEAVAISPYAPTAAAAQGSLPAATSHPAPPAAARHSAGGPQPTPGDLAAGQWNATALPAHNAAIHDQQAAGQRRCSPFDEVASAQTGAAAASASAPSDTLPATDTAADAAGAVRAAAAGQGDSANMTQAMNHEVSAAEEPLQFDHIDVQEQRHILRDIEARKALDRRRTTGSRDAGGQQGKKRASAGGTGGTKRGKAVPAGQTQLKGFFVKQSAA